MPSWCDKLVAGVDAVLNFAAKTHVDRSILDAGGFIQTDVHGTFVLLEAAKKHGTKRFLPGEHGRGVRGRTGGLLLEESPLNPRQPVRGHKAGGELIAYSYAIRTAAGAVTRARIPTGLPVSRRS